jgi:hypothetical protein
VMASDNIILVSIPKTPAETIFQYIVGDFESAWDALVSRKGRPDGGGNFMFALLAMILLEFACRVCAKDKTGTKLANLIGALKNIEKRYFTPLPGTWGNTSEFTLPGANPQNHLLGMMFDLIRNGKAHQYQSAIVKLSDGEVDIDLTGAAFDRGLKRPGRRRPKRHLCYRVSLSGDLALYVRTDQLFLDIKRAIEKSKIISPSDTVTDITRPKPTKSSAPSRLYNFTVAGLERQLQNGGHLKGNW